MAGYSGKPLSEKIGIQSGDTILVVQSPHAYRAFFGSLPERVHVVKDAGKDLVRIAHVFVVKQSVLTKQIAVLKKRIHKNGMIWVSWPKKSSGMTTDVDENRVRDIALAGGLVDVKVCAIDDTWSGLKLVYRVKDR